MVDTKDSPDGVPDGPAKQGAEQRARTPFATVAAMKALEKLEKQDRELAASFKPSIERRKKPR